MNDIDPGLKTILESAVPAGAEAVGDWEDVLRRADVPGAGDGKVVRLGRRPRRRVWYGLAAAAVVTGLLVNPAFGVGDRILDWFRGSPAPEHVKDELRGMNAPEEVRALFQGPGVRADEARGVMAIETSRGRAYLWAAPTEVGGWCTVVQLLETQSGVGMGSSACDVGPPPDGVLGVSWGTDLSGDEPFTLLEGRVEPPIVSLELRFADGSTESVPFVERFFIYEVPAGRDPSAIVGRDAQGEIVARQAIHIEDGPPGGQEQTGEAASLRRVIEIKTSAGAKARLLVGDEFATGDERCWELRVENSAWSGSFCPTPTGRVVTYAADPVFEGQEQLLVLVHGFVAPRVASLELRFEDGETVPLRLTEGFFLYELPRSHYSEGHLPSILIARDRAGHMIGRVAAMARP